MSMLHANGIDIHYEEHGSGFPLVWIHGGIGALSDWRAQVVHFGERYRVLCYDVRGHAGSSAPRDPDLYSQDVLVEDLRGFLDTLGIAQAYVGGLSMGGNIALNFAIKHPARARAIIVASTGAGSENPTAYQAKMEAWARTIEAGGMEAMKEELRKLMVVHRTDRDPGLPQLLAQRIEQNALASHPHGIINILRRAIALRPPIYALEPHLKGLRAPTLVIDGEQDWTLPVSHFIARSVPGARLVVIPQAGHNIHMETPAEFNQAVDRFLRGLDG